MTSQMKVLAVDDDQLNIILMEEILSEDYDLLTARSGEEALENAASFRPDLILLDIMMPGIDGYETCRRIRANPDLNHAKVILLSAKALTRERLEGYEAGADDYVTKPFNEDELLAKVRVFLRLKSVEEMDAMKSQLLSLVAHEIRTPLTGITPAVEMLLADNDMMEGERQMWLEMVLQNSQRLLTLAEKGMFLCEFSTGHVQLELEPFDLAELATTVIAEMDGTARKKQVELRVDAPGAVMVDGEKRYLKMALEFVLDNAVKFSPKGGEVRVDFGEKGAGMIFSVTNSGPGIQPKDTAGVFDAFSARRVDEQIVGSGMSMALARAIMRAHGGDLAIESDPGVETTCSGSLPALEPGPVPR